MKVIYFGAALITLVGLATNSLAWDGTDSSSGYDIEIGRGNLVREGRDIEIFDHVDGSYKDVEIQSITRSGSSVEIEVYDSGSGEYRTFEMEDE